MDSAPASVTEYLANLPPDRRAAIEAVRQVILDNLQPGFEEAIQSGMLSYEVPLARLPDTYNDKPLPLACLGSQKNHMALYMMGLYSDPADLRRFEDDFRASGKRLDMGKSCVRFRSLDDLPLDVIGRTIRAVGLAEYVARYQDVRAATANGAGKGLVAKAAKKAAKAAKKAAKAARKAAKALKRAAKAAKAVKAPKGAAKPAAKAAKAAKKAAKQAAKAANAAKPAAKAKTKTKAKAKAKAKAAKPAAKAAKLAAKAMKAAKPSAKAAKRAMKAVRAVKPAAKAAKAAKLAGKVGKAAKTAKAAKSAKTAKTPSDATDAGAEASARPPAKKASSGRKLSARNGAR